jgi:hypothetical protein
MQVSGRVAKIKTLKLKWLKREGAAPALMAAKKSLQMDRASNPKSQSNFEWQCGRG